MMENWKKAVEETSDVIGEMLLETAEGKRTYSYEEIAGAALKAGIIAVLGEGPRQSRVEEAAKVIYEKLHDPKRHKWTSLSQAERVFWIDIAQAATSASDRQFIREAQNLGLARQLGN